MAQFDAYLLENGRWVVNVQSVYIGNLDTTFIIPPVPPDIDAPQVDRLNHEIRIAGRTLILATHLAGAVPHHRLGRARLSLVPKNMTSKLRCTC